MRLKAFPPAVVRTHQWAAPQGASHWQWMRGPLLGGDQNRQYPLSAFPSSHVVLHHQDLPQAHASGANSPSQMPTGSSCASKTSRSAHSKNSCHYHPWDQTQLDSLLPKLRSQHRTCPEYQPSHCALLSLLPRSPRFLTASCSTRMELSSLVRSPAHAYNWPMDFVVPRSGGTATQRSKWVFHNQPHFHQYPIHTSLGILGQGRDSGPGRDRQWFLWSPCH
mmetsp:Transcript_50129/g.150903  ORF Transcript_50129/g.150903 Transcript_50129/m.150903 type:complete len:221 (+) Transcript_50129:1284-1946(+)